MGADARKVTCGRTEERKKCLEKAAEQLCWAPALVGVLHLLNQR